MTTAPTRRDVTWAYARLSALALSLPAGAGTGILLYAKTTPPAKTQEEILTKAQEALVDERAEAAAEAAKAAVRAGASVEEAAAGVGPVTAAVPGAVTAPAPAGPDLSSLLLTTGGVLLALLVLVALLLLARQGRRSRKDRLARKSAMASERAARAVRLERARADLADVASAYAAYECDLLAVLKAPLLSDVTEPLTATFVTTLAAALASEPGDGASATELARFEACVGALTQAWRSAHAHATKVGLRSMSGEEAKTVKRARDLLNLALSPAASESERAVAYERALKLLEGLVTIPPAARAELEQHVRLAVLPAPASARGSRATA
jgi:hypothetical protein